MASGSNARPSTMVATTSKASWTCGANTGAVRSSRTTSAGRSVMRLLFPWDHGRPVKHSLTYPLLHHPAPPELFTGEAIAAVAKAAEEARVRRPGLHRAPDAVRPLVGGRGPRRAGPLHRPHLGGGGHRPACACSPTSPWSPYRNPFLLAKTVATLDSLSGGRVILGAATGYLKSEFRALGVDFDERNELFDEALEVLAHDVDAVNRSPSRAATSPPPATSSCPTPVQQPPPIWIGGNSTAARRRAATHAQGWMPFANPPQANTVVRTPSIWTADDLAPLLAELSTWSRAGGPRPPRHPLRGRRRRHTRRSRLRCRAPSGPGRGSRRHRGDLGRRRSARRRPPGPSSRGSRSTAGSVIRA